MNEDIQVVPNPTVRFGPDPTTPFRAVTQLLYAPSPTGKMKTWTVFENGKQVVRNSVHSSAESAHWHLPRDQNYQIKSSVHTGVHTVFKGDEQVSEHATLHDAKTSIPPMEGWEVREIDVGFEERDENGHVDGLVAHALDLLSRAGPNKFDTHYIFLHEYFVPFTCNDGTIEKREFSVPLPVIQKAIERLKDTGHELDKRKMEKSGRTLLGWYITKPKSK